MDLRSLRTLFSQLCALLESFECSRWPNPCQVKFSKQECQRSNNLQAKFKSKEKQGQKDSKDELGMILADMPQGSMDEFDLLCASLDSSLRQLPPATAFSLTVGLVTVNRFGPPAPTLLPPPPASEASVRLSHAARGARRWGCGLAALHQHSGSATPACRPDSAGQSIEKLRTDQTLDCNQLCSWE